VIPSLPDNSSW